MTSGRRAGRRLGVLRGLVALAGLVRDLADRAASRAERHVARRQDDRDVLRLGRERMRQACTLAADLQLPDADLYGRDRSEQALRVRVVVADDGALLEDHFPIGGGERVRAVE